MKQLINMTYEKLFALYLLEETPLMEVDKMLLNTVGPNTLSDFYIGEPIQGLSFFRLLSKAHTERLSDDDAEVFEQLITEMDEKKITLARKIVQRTFKEIMSVNSKEPDKMTCIGPYPDEEFCFDNDAIVLTLVIDDVLGMSDKDVKNVTEVAADMKENLFADISKDMDAKMELFVSIG